MYFVIILLNGKDNKSYLRPHMIIALLFWSLACMVFIVLASGCVLCLGVGLLFCCTVFMCSATSSLYASRSEVGGHDMAISASRARFRNQFFCLECRLYFSPFWSRAILQLEKDTSVLFTTLG